MDLGTIHGLWTLLILVVFIGIVRWAYSGKQQQRFEEAARLPLEEDDMNRGSRSSEEKHYG
jgi:cytochrome c oxidase cbb3-type subunit 4